MNKKLIGLLIGLVVFSLVLSGCGGIGGKIDEVLKGQGSDPDAQLTGEGKIVSFYNDHQLIIDFLVMFILFMSVALLGLRKMEMKGNAVTGVAIAIGAALALAAIKANISPGFFIPFVKNFFYLIMWLIIFLILKKAMGGHWFWSLVISIVLTTLAFNFGNLFISDKPINCESMWHTPTATLAEESKVDIRTYENEINAMYEAYRRDIFPNTPEELSHLRNGTGDVWEGKNMYEKQQLLEEYMSIKIKKLKKRDNLGKSDAKLLEQLETDIKKIPKIIKGWGKASDTFDNSIYNLNFRPASGTATIEGTKRQGDPLKCSIGVSTVEYGEDMPENVPPVKYRFEWKLVAKVDTIRTVALTDDENEKLTADVPRPEHELPLVTMQGDQWKCTVTPFIHNMESGVVGSPRESNLVEIIAPAGDGVINVKVLGWQGKIVTGAEVKLKKAGETDATKFKELDTNFNGVARFSNLEKGNYIVVEVEATHYEKWTTGKHITLGASEEVTEPVQLKVERTAGDELFKALEDFKPVLEEYFTKLRDMLDLTRQWQRKNPGTAVPQTWLDRKNEARELKKKADPIMQTIENMKNIDDYDPKKVNENTDKLNVLKGEISTHKTQIENVIVDINTKLGP